MFRKGSNVGPIIAFDTKAYNGGIIRNPTDRAIRHDFTFINTGAANLEIHDLKSSCGCTILNRKDNKRVYRPGETGTIEAVLTLGSFGTRSSDILVFSNAINSPERLLIEATFLPEAHAMAVPKRLAFGEIVRDNAVSRLLEIEALTDSGISIGIARIETLSKKVSCTVKATNTSGRKSLLGYHNITFKILVTVCIGELGEFDDTLRVFFDPAVIPALEVPVVGKVVSEWSMRPEKAIFVFSVENKLPNRVITIRNMLGKSFSVRGIENPFAEWLEVRMVRTPDGSSSRAILTPFGKPSVKNVNGIITVRVMSRSEEEVKIPVAVRNYEAFFSETVGE